MKVLRAIGAFFARIGRWIRDTAWVQPLLIVGGIFAIIFSIPYITKGVQSWFKEGDPVEKYYQKYALSFDGVEDEEKKDSEVDRLFQYMEDIDEANGDVSKLNKDDVKKFGEKFFLCFVQENCDGCASGFPGFETLQKNWNKKGLDIDDDNGFRIHTIYIDTVDDDVDSDNLFNDFILNRYAKIFEEVIQVAQESNYCINQDGSTSTYYSLAGNMLEEGKFNSPTTFLVEANPAEPVNWEYGVNEVLFDYSPKEGQGDGKFARAATLCDAWNHKGIFSDEYQKQ